MLVGLEEGYHWLSEILEGGTVVVAVAHPGGW
jgi:hypothetical protein